jgi:hypothetical protein
VSQSQVNLVLVQWSEHAATERDLRQIAADVTQTNSAVRAFVVRHHKIEQLRLLPIWSKPTLSISFFSLPGRKLLPGRFLCGRMLQKDGEYRRLDAAGIPVPQWTVITPETRLDPSAWGPYVVEKPVAGRRGANIRIRRTSRISYVSPDSLPDGHCGRDGPMLAQRFIYTGEWPTSYRVVTLFGHVLLCYRQVSHSRGNPLRGRWRFETGGVSIVSNTMTMEVTLANDPDIIALAERAHREAFADYPVLGFDIVRDVETGLAYVLECHAQGSWLFTADTGLGIEAANRIDFRSQFDPIKKAARVLADEALARAAVRWPMALSSQTR